MIIPLTEEGIENVMSSFSRLYNTCTFTNKGLICNKFPLTGLVQHRIRNMILMILMNCIPLVHSGSYLPQLSLTDCDSPTDNLGKLLLVFEGNMTRSNSCSI